MLDEHKLLREQDRASKVAALLENEYLKEAFKALEETYIETWRATGPLDTAMREKLFNCVKTIGEVQDHLRSYLADGQMAAVQLKALAERPKITGL